MSRTRARFVTKKMRCGGRLSNRRFFRPRRQHLVVEDRVLAARRVRRQLLPVRQLRRRIAAAPRGDGVHEAARAGAPRWRLGGCGSRGRTMGCGGWSWRSCVPPDHRGRTRWRFVSRYFSKSSDASRHGVRAPSSRDREAAVRSHLSLAGRRRDFEGVVSISGGACTISGGDRSASCEGGAATKGHGDGSPCNFSGWSGGPSWSFEE